MAKPNQADNAVTATSQTGEADGQGGGLSNIGILDLRDTPLAANTVTVDGAAGGARGGGIWNGERRGRPRLPATAPIPSMSGRSCVTSLRWPPVSVAANGTP